MSSPDELYWQIALTMIPGIGIVRAHRLADHFKSAKAIFHASFGELAYIGKDSKSASEIKHFNKGKEVDQTIAYVQRHGIQTLFLSDDAYPSRLKKCYDPPVLLYYMGNVPLNRQHILSVIGTRTPSDYGRQLTATLLKELANYDVLVVSGLADGIDAQAHRCALGNRLPTVGVLGHGLDTIYPTDNRSLAKEMLSNGGLLTEFRQRTPPSTFNFPRRNRIVAGMSDATVIVETAIKGGSMVTASLAFGYNREIFAFPGRTTDFRSSGCHALIRQNKAALVTSASDIAYYLNWEPVKKTPAAGTSPGSTSPNVADATTSGRLPDGAAFSEHAPLLQLLQNEQSMHVDELRRRSGLPATTLAAALLTLEWQQIIESLPGNRYRLSNAIT